MKEPGIKKAITIVGFGDSITQAVIQMPDEKKRWLSVLQQKLAQAHPDAVFTIINAGIGGNSAREAMARFEKDVLAHNPDIVLLEFGGNNNDPAKPERRVSPAEFSALLQQYKSKLSPQTQTIVITFPPVIEEWHAYWKTPALRTYTLASEVERGIEVYRKMTREFAITNGYPLFDLNERLVALGASKGRDKYTLPDGVHLTEEANRVLAEGIFEILNRLIPDE